MTSFNKFDFCEGRIHLAHLFVKSQTHDTPGLLLHILREIHVKFVNCEPFLARFFKKAKKVYAVQRTFKNQLKVTIFCKSL
jgi:hypothetical protein